MTVEASPLVDIVGVGLKNGQILFLNLKKDSIVFSLRQKNSPTVIAFSPDSPFMATGDSTGSVILWNLEQKRIAYKMEGCMPEPIDSLLFIPGMESVLTVGSSASNSIKQLRVNFDDNKILTLLRERVGNRQPLTSVQIASNNDLLLKNST